MPTHLYVFFFFVFFCTNYISFCSNARFDGARVVRASSLFAPLGCFFALFLCKGEGEMGREKWSESRGAFFFVFDEVARLAVEVWWVPRVEMVLSRVLSAGVCEKLREWVVFARRFRRFSSSRQKRGFLSVRPKKSPTRERR